MNKLDCNCDGARNITEPIRRRLPAYYRELIKMYAGGDQRVSSEELAAALKIAPSQVRGDMTAIGCCGQTGYGYLITKLYKRIGEVLRIQDCYSAVIIGEGALVETLSGLNIFTRRGVKLIGEFDTSLRLVKSSENAVVSDNAEDDRTFKDFCKSNSVDIMILACESELALRCVGIAEELGVLGIWNFSDIELRSERAAVRNLHIEDSLMMLCSELPQRRMTADDR